MKLAGNIQIIPIWGDWIPGNTGVDKKIYMQPDLRLRMNQLIGAKGGLFRSRRIKYQEFCPNEHQIYGII